MGGVQKEFFHVLVDSIFDPSYGMFNYVEQSRCFWFNSELAHPNASLGIFI